MQGTELTDTDPRIAKVLIAGFRRMPAQAKLERVASLNRALDELGRARLRAQHGPRLSPHEEELRLASLRLPKEIMQRVFGWDVKRRGY